MRLRVYTVKYTILTVKPFAIHKILDLFVLILVLETRSSPVAALHLRQKRYLTNKAIY